MELPASSLVAEHLAHTPKFQMGTNRAGDVVAAYPLFQAGGGGATPTSALQLHIERINMRLAMELNHRWHSMLPRNNPQLLGHFMGSQFSIAFAATYDANFYAVAIWCHPQIRTHDDGRTIELARLAICDSAPKNTASRMLRVMRLLIVETFPKVNRMISYLAVDVHSGTIYKAAGWKPVGEIVQARPQRFSNINKKTRATGPLQTTSRKQRWEFSIGTDESS